MNKSDLLGKLAEYSFTEDVLQAVKQELASYPEQLSEDDVRSFDAFLQNLQMSETEESLHINQLADFLDQTVEQADQNIENFARDTMKSMKTGLSHAQDLVGMAE